ncbi:MAG: [protein-PII] uridylyltransferase [Gammaproteobacteria bacterium]|nr:[protein-PII] uridylyltransferase [Gammaproteobacteria bacterium]
MVANINSNQSSEMVATVREQLSQFNQSLTIKDDNIPATHLIRQRSDYIDDLLSRLWQFFLGDQARQYALIAIGGYGRRELFPFSDIDLLILTERAPDQTIDQVISAFLQCLWDIGLKPAQSIQTVAQSISLAQNDINFMTSILDTRFIFGNQQLPGLLTTQFSQIITCSAETFFNLKMNEQRIRHEKFGETGYRLEPNIKEGPGGLRDLQTIRWVAQSQYQINTLAKLIDIGLITEKEYLEYRDARRFLWKIRYTLHQLANKPEERLLFEYQTKIAEIFGYSDDDSSRAVEKFMQKYYCTIMEAERLNEMLLQVLATKFEPLRSEQEVTELNNNFRIVGQYLEVTDDQVFHRYPPALIEIFAFMQQNQHLKGIHVSTLRLIRESLELIDDQFRADPDAIRTFMVLWRQGTGLTHELRRMKRYGVIAAYLPEFDYILGRMQFDLFHTLTVDEHILFVVRNLRRMSIPDYRHELPFCHDLFHSIRKPHLLYLAGLFHDIGKGHGGNHSEIGAEITGNFCKRHGLNQHDTDILTWLVTNHLHMSMTAQRLDISDPDVINEFALHCKTLERLNYLYLLTVADIRATNPELWNAWKDSLLRQLYDACRRAFRRGLNNPVTHQEIIAAVRNESSHQLLELGIDKTKFQDIWKHLNDDYFIRHSAKECTWHTLALLVSESDDCPLVCIRPLPFKQAAEIFAHARDNFPLFTSIAHTLDRLGLNVVDARMLPTNDKAIVCSFLVVENSAQNLEDLLRQQQIVNEIKQRLADIQATDSEIMRRSSEKLQNFTTPTQVLIYDDVYQQQSVIELISTDRPGLLSKMGTALDELKLIIHNAKIATIGERVEDLFYVTDANGNKISLDTETVSGIQQHILDIVDGE